MPQQPSSNPAMANPGMTPGTAATPDQIGDQSFVAKEMDAGQGQVQLGQLAQQKSQSNDVKQFAQRMISMNTQMQEKWFKPEAKQLGVSEPKSPDKKDKKLIAKLETLSGPQFDAEYIQAVDKEQKANLKEFQQEAQATQNPNVKQIATQGATVTTQHLQLLEQIAKNHNVDLSANGKEVSSK
ncbi:MAG TPA: DUF4142 domain-containing protein [Terracidiphilus sp.]|nr:DUF4142 domain-containing protein [Terracidiphilus sp.]